MNKDKSLAYGCRIGNILVLIKGVRLQVLHFINTNITIHQHNYFLALNAKSRSLDFMASMGSTKTVFPSKLFLFTGRKDKGTK